MIDEDSSNRKESIHIVFLSDTARARATAGRRASSQYFFLTQGTCYCRKESIHIVFLSDMGHVLLPEREHPHSISF